MQTSTKPIPDTTPWGKPFWKAAREGRLVIQNCSGCGAPIFYPRFCCPHCFSENLTWVEASGKGTVYSYTVVKNNAPSAFVQDMPFVVAVITLDEGVRMLSNIVECEPDELKCDMAVEVTFEKLTDEFTLPKFKPVGR